MSIVFDDLKSLVQGLSCKPEQAHASNIRSPPKPGPDKTQSLVVDLCICNHISNSYERVDETVFVDHSVRQTGLESKKGGTNEERKVFD